MLSCLCDNTCKRSLAISYKVVPRAVNVFLLLIQIGAPAKDGKTKPGVWIDGGIHAREWVTPAGTIYIIYTVRFMLGAL